MNHQSEVGKSHLSLPMSVDLRLDKPFPIRTYSRFFSDEVFAELFRSFPDWSDLEAFGSQSSSNRLNIASESLNALEEGSAWRRFFTQDFLAAITESLLSEYSPDLEERGLVFESSDVTTRFDITRARGGYRRGPHLDQRHHLISLLIYFNAPSADGAVGGTLEIWQDTREGEGYTESHGQKFPDKATLTRVLEINPRANTAVSFLNTARAIHGVSDYVAPESVERLFLYLSVDPKDGAVPWAEQVTTDETRRALFLAE